MSKGYDDLLEEDPDNDPSSPFVAPLAWGVLLCFVALILGFIVRSVRAAPLPPIVGMAEVVDGDTIEMNGERLRLADIDAPEGGQTCARNGEPWDCGTDATTAVRSAVSDKQLACNPQKRRDRYGRIVATCFIDGQDLNERIVREGWAMDYPKYSKGKYAAAEKEARAAERGLWVGEFEPPWEWRREHRGE